MSIARRACLLLLCLLSFASWASSEAKSEEESAGPPQRFQYLEMAPAFVVNFGTTGRLGYLKTDVTLRVSSSATGELEHHMPALRHTLIMLLSAQSPEALAEPAGREPLRKAALEAVRKVVADAGVAGTAEEPAVQDLLFTSFLVQR